jgi:glycosyltransferase involved in cell wall biosynthesis
MRIGYDITPIGHQASGVGMYALHLLTHMAELDEGHEFLLLSNQAGHHGRVPAHRELHDAWQPFPSRMLWMQCVLPQTLRSIGAQLCHYPNSIAPLRSPCPYVLTIHDMTLSMLPQHHPWRKQVLIRPLIPLVARRAARVITVSSSARDDIVRLLGLPPERVAVIPEAAGAQFRPTSLAEQRRVCAAYGLRQPYVLYIGTLEPRKNLVRLIRAWGELRRKRVIEHQLVIVGAQGWQYGPIYQEAQLVGCADEVIFTGYLPGEDLPGLYSGADLFAFPSLYEGFGLPVVEAMACGTPVLISTTPALVEVAGEAAYAVDAHSVAAIKAGLEQVLCDAATREQMRAAGLARAAHFSWQHTARCTLEVYREVIAGEGVSALRAR